MSSPTASASGFLNRLKLRHPAQLVVAAFVIGIGIGTALLSLPIAAQSGDSPPLVVAVFTATSALCVTGLVVVDTATYWTTFGHVVILVLIQVGGLGIMTMASALVLVVSRRLGLRTRLTAQAQTGAVDLGDVRRLLLGAVIISATLEGVIALVLTWRYWTAYDQSLAQSLYDGFFHAISAFNNAGFMLYSDGWMRFAEDPVMSLTVVFGVVAGSLGFPVLFELRRELLRPRAWSIHTKLTLATSGLLLAAGTLAITLIEWNNAQTLGRLSFEGKLLAGFFQGAMPRSGGFNTVDYSEMEEASWLITDVLMFIGGGSAGTGGGIKVTTFAVLGLMIVAEARGTPSVNVFNRRVPSVVQRQAVSVALLGVAAVMLPSIAMLLMTDLELDRALFEVISAAGTVGLSTGVTPDLPAPAQYLLVALMLLGRIGPITLASALALRQTLQLYRLPEERPIVG